MLSFHVARHKNYRKIIKEFLLYPLFEGNFCDKLVHVQICGVCKGSWRNSKITRGVERGTLMIFGFFLCFIFSVGDETFRNYLLALSYLIWVVSLVGLLLWDLLRFSNILSIFLINDSLIFQKKDKKQQTIYMKFKVDLLTSFWYPSIFSGDMLEVLNNDSLRCLEVIIKWLKSLSSSLNSYKKYIFNHLKLILIVWKMCLNLFKWLKVR